MSDDKPEGRAEITLAPITNENFRECANLKVAPEQEDFVAPNVYSIAESKVIETCVPMAIYAAEEMVGFVMYEVGSEDGRCSVHRFMISASHQRKGYGRAAMEAVISLLEETPDCDGIYINRVPENVAAGKLYESLGFVETGEIEDGEIVAYRKNTK